jgi:hypothetical protein
MVGAVLFLGEKVVNLFHEGHKFHGVLLRGYSLTESLRAFLGFTLRRTELTAHLG